MGSVWALESVSGFKDSNRDSVVYWLYDFVCITMSLCSNLHNGDDNALYLKGQLQGVD